MTRSFCLSVLLGLAIIPVLEAQRPKVGLTLSGGGAKGLAHVGILQAIDSAGLKIDYVTGTSMGSIIGAMYSIGYSGNQIDSISKKLNWGELLAGKPKFSDVGLEEKDEFGRYSAEIPVEGFKPQMGTGLIESEEVWLQFSEIFFHAYDQKDFMEFDIPFKCIATDLSTGKAVVLSSGEIVKALRSSMALPSIFSAVEQDSAYLVDGGIVRNFPVSDVKQMGADIVIGVNLFSGLTNASEINSAMDVMYQITNYRDAYDLVDQKKQCDILIEPPLEGYSAGSFSDSEDLLEIGYRMKEQYYPYFKKIADSLNQIATIDYDPYNRLQVNKSVIIDSYEIKGLDKIDENVIIQKGSLRSGDRYTSAELNQAFRAIYSTLYFKYIYYELIPTEPGHAHMVVHLKEQTRSQFKVGFSYITFTTPALILNYTSRNLLFSKSRSMIKLALSEDPKALLEHKQFFGHSSANSITMSLKHIQQRVNIYTDNEISNQYKTASSAAELRYNFYLSRNSAFGVHFILQNSSFSPYVASTFRFDGYNRGLLTQLSYEINTLNRPFLPTSGVEARLRFGVESNRKFHSDYTGSDEIDSTFIIQPEDPLMRFDVLFNWYRPITPKTNLIINLQGGQIFADQNFYLDNLLIGGINRIYQNQLTFAGYQDAQIQATTFASGMLGVQHEIFSDFYLLGRANIGIYNFYTTTGWVENISDQLITGFNASVAYNLSLLPFEFGVNYSPEINKFYSSIRIGFIF